MHSGFSFGMVRCIRSLKEETMCDYSLSGVQSRPAKADEKLVTSSFPNTNTRGFGAVGEPGIEVCLRPGTEIVFDEAPVYEQWGYFGCFYQKTRAPAAVARFTQINLHECRTHHDALEFPDGTVVLLNDICKGFSATVLQLPAQTSVDADQRDHDIVEMPAIYRDMRHKNGLTT